MPDIRPSVQGKGSRHPMREKGGYCCPFYSGHRQMMRIHLAAPRQIICFIDRGQLIHLTTGTTGHYETRLR